MICKRAKQKTPSGWIVEVVAIHRSPDPVAAEEVEAITAQALASLETAVEAAPTLDSLSVADLADLAERWEVDTEAQTARGLRRAIERHLEEG